MIFRLVFVFAFCTAQNITTDDNSLRFENGESRIIQLKSEWNVLSYVYTEHQDDVININCTSGSLSTYNCSIEFDTVGYLNITSKSIGVDFLKMNDTNSTIVRTQIIKSEGLYIFNQVIGWIYFLAWTISFYPQIVLNFQRKSVEGLNFDYITLNIIGFACYTAFNWALYFSDYIFNIYEKEHPDGVNPVEINDLFFSIHALVASLVTGGQILIYERAGQKLGYFGMVISALSILTIIFGTIPAAIAKITWLDYLTILSIVKLVITITKYMPQAWMNFRRQSTEGWSIGNVLLDLTGGSFSMLQMLLEGLNNNQFSIIFGDPTKFGLGLFSILFDCLFIVQHYCLYRENRGYAPQLDDYLHHDED